MWSKLPLSSSLSSSLPATPPVAGMLYGGAGEPQAEALGSGASQIPPLVEAGKKSLVGPSLDVGVPAPCADGGVASLGDSTDRTPCNEVDVPQGERAGRGSLTYQRCV
jgi:hypothetical protein